MPLDDNLIAALETSLRQTRNAQNRLMSRLRDAENEVHNLRQEIEALENAAAKTESAIDSILVTSRASGSRAWDRPQPPSGGGGKPSAGSMGDDDGYDFNFEPRFRENSRSTRRERDETQENTYRPGSPVTYINNSRVPSISPNIEAVSHRFSDRTITQACTLLLREYGKSMHVNELYNLLVAGGMEFNGNNPTISIAVSLNRNRRFVKVAPGTFDLVMREAKAAS